MNSVAIFLAAAALGIDSGWQPIQDGTIEYIIQVEPKMVDSMKQGGLTHYIPPKLRGRVSRIRIQIGTGALPNSVQRTDGSTATPAPATPANTYSSGARSGDSAQSVYGRDGTPSGRSGTSGYPYDYQRSDERGRTLPSRNGRDVTPPSLYSRPGDNRRTADSSQTRWTAGQRARGPGLVGNQVPSGTGNDPNRTFAAGGQLGSGYRSGNDGRAPLVRTNDDMQVRSANDASRYRGPLRYGNQFGTDGRDDGGWTGTIRDSASGSVGDRPLSSATSNSDPTRRTNTGSGSYTIGDGSYGRPSSSNSQATDRNGYRTARRDDTTGSTGSSTYQPGSYQPGSYRTGNQPNGTSSGTYQPGSYQPGNYKSGTDNSTSRQPSSTQGAGTGRGSYQPNGYQPGSYQPGNYRTASGDARGTYGTSTRGTSTSGQGGGIQQPGASSNSPSGYTPGSYAPGSYSTGNRSTDGRTGSTSGTTYSSGQDRLSNPARPRTPTNGYQPGATYQPRSGQPGDYRPGRRDQSSTDSSKSSIPRASYDVRTAERLPMTRVPGSTNSDLAKNQKMRNSLPIRQISTDELSTPDVPRPWGILAATGMALMASMGGNAYLGWVFYGLHSRYRRLLVKFHRVERDDDQRSRRRRDELD